MSEKLVVGHYESHESNKDIFYLKLQMTPEQIKKLDEDIKNFRSEVIVTEHTTSEQVSEISKLQTELSKAKERINELESALDLVIPRCVKCFNYATMFCPKKMWPLCGQHGRENGAIITITYHNAIKAKAVLDKKLNCEVENNANKEN